MEADAMIKIAPIIVASPVVKQVHGSTGIWSMKLGALD
jgi:hypothetical protein